MKEIASICDRHNIPYYLVGGSMIGAIRHQGFIPWDDDIDMAIPRPYYGKFLDVVNKELSSFYNAKSSENSSEYVYSFIKVEDIRTEIEFPWTKGCGLHESLCVDVFVFDGTPQNRFLRSIYCYYIQRLIAIKGALYLNENMRTPIKRMVSKLLKKIVSFKKQTVISFIDNQMQRYEFSKSDYVVNYNGVYGKREIIHKKILGSPTNYIFEDTQFSGVENYHEFLTSIYGDYMVLPPKEKQTNHSLTVTFKMLI